LSLEVNGETYFTAAEAARQLGISRDTFNRNVAPRLQQYSFGVLRRIYYRQSDLDQFRQPHPIERDSQDNG
jgi:excisionase family DNA binding protein